LSLLSLAFETANPDDIFLNEISNFRLGTVVLFAAVNGKQQVCDQAGEY